MSGRTVFVGDVHGCADELEDLLDACALAEGDRLVFVGDLVAKGPDSLRVVRRVMQLGAPCVRGNHEDAVLRARHPGPGAPPRLKPTHRAVADALGEPEWQFLESLPFTLTLPELDVLVVHAGVVPSVPLEEQRAVDLMCMRSLRPDGTASTRLEEGRPWAEQWPGPTHVVFGHDAITGLQQHPFATGIDTGCVYGRRLTALSLPDGRLVSVPARRAYVQVG